MPGADAAARILAVETSCDETSVAILEGERDLRAHLVLSQDEHRVWGGVVPEIASRAHLARLDDVVSAALAEADLDLGEIDLYAATAGPGLIGALLVGLTWAKTAAWANRRPFLPVHHMEGHLFAANLEDPAAEPPFLALLVSGGHTLLVHVEAWGRYRLLGETRDDAAGEAFDKAAKMLGLGYPGGPAIEVAAREGDGSGFALPRPLLSGKHSPGDPGYLDFSFSGLKTALRNAIAENGGRSVPDLAASFQEAVIDVLATKTERALGSIPCERVVLGGGVARNLRLREVMAERLEEKARLFVPSPRMSSDNAGMIARAARFHSDRGEHAALEVSARADLPWPGMER